MAFLVNSATDYTVPTNLSASPGTITTRKHGEALLPGVAVSRPASRAGPISSGPRPQTSGSQRHQLRTSESLRPRTSYSDRVHEGLPPRRGSSGGGPPSAVKDHPHAQLSLAELAALYPEAFAQASRASTPASSALLTWNDVGYVPYLPYLPREGPPRKEKRGPPPGAFTAHGSAVDRARRPPSVSASAAAAAAAQPEPDRLVVVHEDEEATAAPVPPPAEEAGAELGFNPDGPSGTVGYPEHLMSRTPTPANAMDRVWAELSANTRRLPNARSASRGTLDTLEGLFLDRKSLLSFDEFQSACAAFGKRDAFNHLQKLFKDIDVHATGYVTMRDFISSDLMQWDKFAKPTLGPAWERPGPGRAFTNALDAGRFQTLRQRVQDMHARQGAVQTLATSMARSKLQGKVTAPSSSGKLSADQIMRAFRFFDKQRTGTVTSEEFVSVIAFMAIPVGDGAMMDELLRTFDKRGDGRVDYLEFLYMFHGAPTRKLWRQANKPVLYSPPIGRRLPW